MSLTTYSLFYYGHTVTEDNQLIDFKEGDGDALQATLNIGEYTLTDYLTEIKRAMEAAGDLVYTVTVNRTTRVITISSTSAFSLLVSSGDGIESTAFTMIGFTGDDLTGETSYTADTASGSEFEPQYYLQDYIASNDFKEAVDGVVNESASGKIETVTFGTRQFIQMNFQYATDKNPTGSSLIKAQTSALANLRSFMDYIITKAPVEFMPNTNARSTFENLVLEKTPGNSKGMGYQLRELVDDHLPGYFETGEILFRKVS